MTGNRLDRRSRTVVGLDGCRQGWLGAVWQGPGHAPSAIFLKSLYEAELELPSNTVVIAVDIPLGLLDSTVPGGRPCDRQARKLLGPRASSVFSPPAKESLLATNYEEANRFNRESGPEGTGLSKQSFAIFPKLIDAEKSIARSHWLRDRIIEVHPELCFTAMACSPLKNAKKKAPGKDERRIWLRNSKFENLETFESNARKLGAAVDDSLDACAAAWTAWRHADGTAVCLPSDATGPNFSMRIWY